MKTPTTCCVLATLAIAGWAHADTYIVDPAGNGDYLSIQTAVRWAPEGSTITVVPGVYGGVGIDGRETHAVTIEAVDWAPEGSVIIEGDELDESAINLTEYAEATFRGLVVRTRGWNLVQVNDSTATFEGCRLEDAEGVGLTIRGESNVTFSAGVISGMVRGGVEAWHSTGTITILDSLLENNSGDVGGAIEARGWLGTRLVLRRTDFIGNHASVHGGALWVGSSQETVVIEGCRFIGNQAGTHGGAIWSGNTSLQVWDTLVSGNVAGVRGGGISLLPDRYVTQKFTNCLITGNLADASGGGVMVELFNTSCDVRFKSCEITDNMGQWDGGGVANTGLGEVELYDSLICGNLPEPASGNLYLSNTPVVDTCGTGACCLEEMCVQLTQSACMEAAGTWHGANVDCEKVQCTFETGACCFGSYCLLMTEWECGQHDGRWHGAAVFCADASCEKPKPGDLDRDGNVDINDLLKLFGYWGT
ncbi:MAG: right-handed parallel beta-helix repeat-containing protein [Phycisphaerales bacterium]|nr:right-handed parallel beta-helix repeat-containing protein [Phycisphaerales bacterium]